MANEKTIRLSSENLGRFYQQPEDAGQIVEVSYALASDHELLVCRSYDRSDRTTSYHCAELDPDGDDTFEPWNGQLPATVGGWDPCEVDDDD